MLKSHSIGSDVNIITFKGTANNYNIYKCDIPVFQQKLERIGGYCNINLYEPRGVKLTM